MSQRRLRPRVAIVAPIAPAIALPSRIRPGRTCVAPSVTHSTRVNIAPMIAATCRKRPTQRCQIIGKRESAVSSRQSAVGSGESLVRAGNWGGQSFSVHSHRRGATSGCDCSACTVSLPRRSGPPASRHVLSGATRLDFQPNADHCFVYADPAGHPFCLSTWDGPHLDDEPEE